MKTQNAMLGMGLAMVAGAAAAMALAPRQQKAIKKTAEKAAHTVGEAVEQFTQNLSM